MTRPLAIVGGPELIDGLLPAEFLARQKGLLGRGRPPKELQAKLNRARELVTAQKAAASERHANPDTILASVEFQFECLRWAGNQMIRPGSRFVALVASGVAGIGKTHTLHTEIFGPAAARGEIHYQKYSGYTTAVMLMKLLYASRSAESVLLLDDNDAIFGDKVALGILKAALDSHPVRRVSWLSATDVLTEEEKEFDFEGRVAFVTNTDLNLLLQKDNDLTDDLQALRSRSHYLDLGLHSKHAQALWTARIVRKHDVVVKAMGVTPKEQEAIVKYILKNYDRASDISIRAAINMGAYVGMVKDSESADDWRKVAQAFGY